MRPSKKLKFYFTNRESFKTVNYDSLYELASKHRIRCYFNDKRINWMKCFGNYTIHANHLKPHVTALEKLNKEQLKSFAHHKVNVFSCVRAELLSFLLTRPEWYNVDVPINDDALFDMMWEKNKLELLLNMAAAIDWLDFWTKAKSLDESFTHVFMFSGSSIYTKTLGQVLTNRNIKPVLIEQFFTGNDYYCEQKNEPLANGSDLKYADIYNSYKIPTDFKQLQVLRSNVRTKIVNMSNKNVFQPPAAENVGDKFPKESKIVLILGQVVNDFSVIETANENLNSIAIYKKLIRGLLDNTDYNIVFKAHPWERRKANTNEEPITLNEIHKFRDSLTDDEADRLFLTENFNIYKLFSEVDFVTAICSQGAIEAAYYGFKPIMFGNPFFGKKGFTIDCTNTDEAIKAIASAESGLLTIDEFKLLENFLIVALERHLVSNRESGVSTLESKFNIQNNNRKKNGIGIQKIRLEDFKISKVFRRTAKFICSPKAFCEDSRFGTVRYFARFYKK